MIKYLVMDVDGTLTDGKIYMGQKGEVMKAFSVKDGYVINFILKPFDIVPIIITARNSDIVQHRCDELGITEVHQGKLDKLKTLKTIVGEEHIGTCAYFGDDILDLKCMIPIKDAGGIVACPSDAVVEVKAIADYICINQAGEGALREFSEWLVKTKVDDIELQNRVNSAINYLRKLKVDETDAGTRIVVDEYFFYSVQSYVTKPADECKLESHKKFVDIQVMVSGSEAMDIVDTSRLTLQESYDATKDVMFWKISSRTARTTLTSGDIIVLYPEHAHRGAVSIENSTKVVKIVGKVKID